MKIEIVPSNYKHPLAEGWMRLTENDFNNIESFFATHPNIQPESVDEIAIRGILEVHPYPHIIIRHCDWLLKVGGQVTFETIFLVNPCHMVAWSYCQLRYLMSICLRDHFKCTYTSTNEPIEPQQKLIFKKTTASLPEDDAIDKWTFGICSNGRANERVRALIESIIKQNIPNFEVIVCGPSPYDKVPEYVHVVDDGEIYDKEDVRFPIGKKKMLIAKNAKYNNMFIMHDRFLFPDDWYQNMQKYGNYFDVLTPLVQTYDGKGRLASISFINAKEGRYTSDEAVTALANIPMGEIDSYRSSEYELYINGGLLVSKRNVYMTCPIPTYLHWVEIEDQEWGRLLKHNGYLVAVDKDNYIMGESPRVTQSAKSASDGFVYRVRSWMASKRYNCYRRISAVKQYEQLYGIAYKDSHYVSLSIQSFLWHVLYESPKKLIKRRKK